MALRKIVNIDEDLCDGCGECVPSCAEGALQIVDGKARLVKDIYCDGLGACLGQCPHDAITIEEREAPAFDEAATEVHLEKLKLAEQKKPEIKAQPDLPCGCPGSAMKSFKPVAGAAPFAAPVGQPVPGQASALNHWPIQLMLVPAAAPFLKQTDLLICADCVPFAVPDFHSKFLEGRSVLVGCPKLDNNDFYREKLAEIFATAQPTSINVLRMEVPCCGGIAQAVLEARDKAAVHMPVVVHTIGIRGGSHREVFPGKAQAAHGGA